MKRQRVMLDLFCGRLGWSKAFLARGWKVIGVDLVEPPEIPDGVEFRKADVMDLAPWDLSADFICASSPCEEFSIHGMKHFHPNPKYPVNGIILFNYTRQLCESSGRPYVMENVRPAQQFVGKAVHHCGPFYLWGTGVPAIMPQGINKGMKLGGGLNFAAMNIEERRKHRTKDLMLMAASGSEERREWTERVATIPPELASCVAAYADAILDQRDQGNK